MLCRCDCGRHVLDYVAFQTGGLHFECFLAEARRPITEIIIATPGGGRVKMPQRKRRKRHSKGRQETRRTVEHARTRAMRRLRHMFPDEFALLYAEERTRVGLPPAVRRTPLPVTYPQAGTYDAATPALVEP